MKKNKFFIVIITLVLSLILFSCKSEILSIEEHSQVKYTEIKNINELNKYDIKISLDSSHMTYSGQQYISYLNKSGDDLASIYFHLYPNAFKRLEDAPILFNLSSKNYVGGYIDIEKVTLDNMTLDFEVDEELESILEIKLPEALKSGEKMEIYMEYIVKIPTTRDRFGYHDNGINLGNFYPIASVYDEDGWNLDPYYKVGDPFFSEVSNYNVEIIVASEMEVAASGNKIDERLDGDKRIYSFKGENIRDFALVASENFVIGRRQVDDTLIEVYSINDNQEMIDIALDYGENAMRIFNEKFGEYPYDEYVMVNTEFPSGMEYPGLVLISNDYFDESLMDILELVIVHETAHQWWYGVVGTNQIEEPWIDEGLATYSEVIYMEELYGEEAGDFHYNQSIKKLYDTNFLYLGEDKRVDKPLGEFENWNDYSLLVYSRGVGFFKELDDKYGRPVFQEILQEAYGRYKYKNMSAEDFIGLCEEITGESMEELLEKHLRDEKNK